MAEAEINYDQKYAVIKSDKFTTTFTVYKDISGHRFFEFKTSKGNLPEELKGKYSSIEKAIKGFEAYERKVKTSPRKRRDDWQKRKEEKRVVSAESS